MLLSNGFDPDPRVYNEALALTDRGYRVTLMCWDRDRHRKKLKRETLRGIQVERLGPRSRHNLGLLQVFLILFFWLGLIRRVLFREVDVIHCHDFDTLPPGLLLARLKRCKLVYDSHENFSQMIRHDVGNIVGMMIARVERIILRHVDLTVTVGDTLAQELAQRGANNVHVVGNWKNPEDFVFAPEELAEIRKTLPLEGHDKLIITYITSLKTERKILELMEAIRGRERFMLILGGKGPLEKSIQEKLEGREDILFLGFVNPTDVPKYTAISDVVFYGFEPSNENSRYSAPNKLFEALAAGKVIISGDFGEIGRIIQKYKCGLIIEDYSPVTIRNALEYLHDHVDQLIERKHNASLLGRSRYNWRLAKEVLCERYEDLIRSSRECRHGTVVTRPSPAGHLRKRSGP